jgi:hypothetical protein
MRKLLPVVLSGFLAVSFSQLAAAQSVGAQGQAGTGANVDLNKQQGQAGAGASADVNTQQSAGASSGATSSDEKDRDAKAKPKSPDKAKQGANASGGATAGAHEGKDQDAKAKGKTKAPGQAKQGADASGSETASGGTSAQKEPSSSAGATSDQKKEDKKY